MLRLYTTILFFCFFCFQASAQKRYADSLQMIIQDARVPSGKRIMALCDLADIIRYSDTGKAMNLAQKALALAEKEKEVAYRLYAYDSRAFVYLSKRDLESAHKDAAACLELAAQTNDIKAKSWAWYRKGRMLSFEDRTKETIDPFLKALGYIKGKGYWKEEAAIYYGLYGSFSTWEDLDNQDKYAKLALEAAIKSRDPNRLCESWQAIAICTQYRYQQTKQKDLLDSALRSNKMAISIYRQHEPYMRMVQLITIPTVNTANLYNRYFPIAASTTDSIRHYATMAFDYAVKGKDIMVQAASLGILNEDAQRNGNYKLAERYLLRAQSLLLAEPKPNYYILASVHEGLSAVAEKEKNFEKALAYYKAFKEDHRRIFDAQQAQAGKELEAKYNAKETAQKIKTLTEREAFQRRQKLLYIGIGLALLTGLIFMFRSYRFKLRYAIQRETILKQEKEEARLLAKLKDEEALLLEADKQKAQLQAKLKAEEAARLLAEQQVVQARNQMLQKEIMASSLHAEQKDRVLEGLKSQLDDNPGKDIKASDLNKLIREQNHLDKGFSELKTELRDVHPEFYRRLQEKADNKLTPLDLKYCAYVYLKRSTLEMANIAGVEPKSIRMSKYRIKQKLGLSKEVDLDAYISSIV